MNNSDEYVWCIISDCDINDKRVFFYNLSKEKSKEEEEEEAYEKQIFSDKDASDALEHVAKYHKSTSWSEEEGGYVSEPMSLQDKENYLRLLKQEKKETAVFMKNCFLNPSGCCALTLLRVKRNRIGEENDEILKNLSMNSLTLTESELKIALSNKASEQNSN